MKQKENKRKSEFLRMNSKELREQAKNIRPILRLGKNGITDNVVKEIESQLKINALIKIKLLESFRDSHNRRVVCSDIAEKTKSEIILQVGGTLVLFKR